MWGSDSSYSDSSSDTSEDGDSGAGERGAELYSISVVAPLNMDSDTSQQGAVKMLLYYYGCTVVRCKIRVIFCMSCVFGKCGMCFSLEQ